MSTTTHEGTGWKIADVDEIPPVKPDWPATWKSVRHHFGISAFGINAVTKDAGNVLIPEHDERSSLDGEAGTVPAGGMVSVGPAVTRKLEATASPTTLVVVGATPGKAYE